MTGFYHSIDLDRGAVQTSLTALDITTDELDDLILRGATSAVDVLKLDDVPAHVLSAARHMIERMADHAVERQRLFDERAAAYDADRYAKALTVAKLTDILKDLPADARIYSSCDEDFIFKTSFEDGKLYL